MVEMPKVFQGLPVVHSVRHVTDESEAPYAGTMWLDHGNGEHTVTSAFSYGGDNWHTLNGAHRVPVKRAAEVFAEKCERGDRFKAMVLSHKVTWEAVALLQWNPLPVTGREEFTVYARHAAGLAMEMNQLCQPGNRKVWQAIEGWLSRYDKAHGKDG